VNENSSSLLNGYPGRWRDRQPRCEPVLISPVLVFLGEMDFFFYIYFQPNCAMLNPVKLEHFRNLVSLSAVDGKIEEVERVALSKIAYEQGIPLDRLNVMLQRAKEYIYLIPQNQQERETQLQEMLDLAMVDGEFARAERELITMVAEKLGFTKDELDSFIEAHLPGKHSD
jgi:hypothetical protein